MSEPKVSLNDLESIMKASEVESDLLHETTEPVAHIIPQEVATTPTQENLPEIPPIDIKDALNHTGISAMLNQMTSNPDEVNRMMEESMNRMTPEMMDQARKLAMGGQGDQIMREMQKRGIDPKAMRAQMLQQKRALRGLCGKNTESTTQVILITMSRQVKVRRIPRDNISVAAGSILKCNSPVELSCSRLAQGPLAGKTIKVWYDPEHVGKNRRASKIVGFSIGGEIVIVTQDEDLTESNFLAAERQLN